MIYPARSSVGKLKVGEGAAVASAAHTLFGFSFRDAGSTAQVVKVLDGEKGNVIASANFAAKGNATMSMLTGVEVRSGAIYIETSAGEVEWIVYWL